LDSAQKSNASTKFVGLLVLLALVANLQKVGAKKYIIEKVHDNRHVVTDMMVLYVYLVSFA
jgi:hypothetical protein